ncbi:energy-coupling factor transporter transmembrane component T [Halegenticoccus soli]|uniref:energy-coupling factor transporter transmembrane component T n=1 Tax=Halegenticoccus soli TaxID=1985678 RepID=UPI000C6D6692|nr:energy-coupling factor transporter transmembrane component T [Halegenticoccus soli]
MNGEPVAYHPDDSVVHRLHPVTKVVLLVCCILGAYLAPVPVLLALLAALAGAASLAGVGRAVGRAAVPILVPLGVGLLVIHGLFTKGAGVALLAVGPVTLWREGVLYAVSFFGVLTAFVLAGLLFVTTTHPKKLMVSLTEKGVPRKLGYVFVASLQLVPDLQRRAGRILDAQRSRGLDTSGSPRNRILALVALLTPLLIGALISTRTRSLALEARGFSIEGPRSSLYSLVESPLDHALRVAAVLGVVALVAWRLV